MSKVNIVCDFKHSITNKQTNNEQAFLFSSKQIFYFYLSSTNEIRKGTKQSGQRKTPFNRIGIRTNRG